MTITIPAINSVAITILPDQRLDTKNASLYLGLAENTLAVMRWSGKGPKFIKPSRRIYYFKDDLDAWINAYGRVNSTSQADMQRAS